MKKIGKFLFIFAITLFMAACSGDGGSTAGNNATPTSGGSNNGVGSSSNTIALSGSVNKGPVMNATVDIYTFNTNGTQGSFVVGGIITNADGTWSATIPSSAMGPWMMIATGGSFVDEYTGATVTLGIVPLRGILPAGATSAAITPLSDAAVSTIQQMVRDGYAASPAAALPIVQTNYINSLGFDPITVIPPSPTNLAGATAKQLQYAAILGGISTLANDAYTQLTLGGNAPDRMEIVVQMANDFAADGSIDGYGAAAAPLTVNVGGSPQALNGIFTGGNNLSVAVATYQGLATAPAQVAGVTVTITPVDFTQTVFVQTPKILIVSPANASTYTKDASGFVAIPITINITNFNLANGAWNIILDGISQGAYYFTTSTILSRNLSVGSHTIQVQLTGAGKTYTPLASQNTDTITIHVQAAPIVGGGGTTGGGTVTLNASTYCPVNPIAPPTPTINGWQWAQPSHTGTNLNTVVEGNGVFLAAGDFGQMLRSTDKINWVAIDSGTITNINEIIWDGSAFIIPSDPIAISCDGLNWVRKPLVTTLNGTTTTFFPARVVLADKYYAFNGNAMYQSTDAVNWTGNTIAAVTAVGKFASFRLVANNGTTFVAKTLNPEVTLVSSDSGTTWQTVVGAPAGYRLLYWNGTHFVADLNFDIATSIDGISWVTTPIAGGIAFSTVWTPHMITYQGTHVRYGGNDFMQGSSYNNNGGLYVPDPTSTWRFVDWHDITQTPLLKINNALITSSNTLLVVGDGGMIAEHVSPLVPMPVLNSPGCCNQWNRLSNDITPTPLRKIASDGSTFVAVGDFGNILSSTDGYTWTKSTLPTYKPTAWLTIPIDKTFNEVLWTGTEYLAIGNNTTLLTSPNGQTWTLNGVVQATGVGSVPSILDPANGTIVRSDNYIHTKDIAGVYRLGDNVSKWTKVDISGGLAVAATAFADNGTRYVAIGSYGISSTLTPSGTWAAVTLTNIPSINTYSFVAIAHDGTKFLAVANNTVSSTQVVIQSVDGLAWTQVTPLVGTPNFGNTIRGASGKFISLGNTPKESLDGGITWTNILPHQTLSSGWNNYDFWYDYLQTPAHEFLIGYRNTILVK